MKLVLSIANVVAVTPLMLKHGTGDEAALEPATALTLRADTPPSILEELREGLADKFFEPAEKGPRVPCIPELAGALGWKTEFESATLKLDLSNCEDLDFSDEELVIAGTELKGIEFEPLSTGMVGFKCNAIIRSDDPELRGKLNGLLRHTVSATFTKLTQKPLAEPKKAKDDASTSSQEPLPLH